MGPSNNVHFYTTYDLVIFPKVVFLHFSLISLNIIMLFTFFFSDKANISLGTSGLRFLVIKSYVGTIALERDLYVV